MPIDVHLRAGQWIWPTNHGSEEYENCLRCDRCLQIWGMTCMKIDGDGNFVCPTCAAHPDPKQRGEELI
jgi:hypothetical protein